MSAVVAMNRTSHFDYHTHHGDQLIKLFHFNVLLIYMSYLVSWCYWFDNNLVRLQAITLQHRLCEKQGFTAIQLVISVLECLKIFFSLIFSFLVSCLWLLSRTVGRFLIALNYNKVLSSTIILRSSSCSCSLHYRLVGFGQYLFMLNLVAHHPNAHPRMTSY